MKHKIDAFQLEMTEEQGKQIDEFFNRPEKRATFAIVQPSQKIKTIQIVGISEPFYRALEAVIESAKQADAL